MTTTTVDTYPMPDLHCPDWCDRDHLPDWEMHVSVGLDTRGIPMADGTVSYSKTPLSEWLDMFEPLHMRTLGKIDLGSREYAVVDVQRGADDETILYVDAQGALTSEQARRYAAELLNAADMLDGINEHTRACPRSAQHGPHGWPSMVEGEPWHCPGVTGQ